MSIVSGREREGCAAAVLKKFFLAQRHRRSGRCWCDTSMQWLLHNEIALAVCSALPDQSDVGSSIIIVIVIVIVIVSSARDLNMIFEIFTQPSSEGQLGHKSFSKLIGWLID